MIKVSFRLRISSIFIFQLLLANVFVLGCQESYNQVKSLMKDVEDKAVEKISQRRHDVDLVVYILREGRTTIPIKSVFVYTMTPEYVRSERTYNKRKLSDFKKKGRPPKEVAYRKIVLEFSARATSTEKFSNIVSKLKRRRFFNNFFVARPKLVEGKCFYDSKRAVVVTDDFYSFMGPYAFNYKNTKLSQDVQVIKNRIEPVDRTLKDHEKPLWSILIILQLMESLSSLSKEGIHSMNVHPKSVYLKTKYVPAWLDQKGFGYPNYHSLYLQNSFNNSKLKTVEDKIKHSQEFQTYKDFKLYWAHTRKPLSLSYSPAAQIHAFAFLMIQIMDPTSTIYNKEDLKYSHKEILGNYCGDLSSSTSLPCLFFHDVLTKMLAVKLDDHNEKFEVHFRAFVKRVNEIFNFEINLKQVNRYPFIDNITPDQNTEKRRLAEDINKNSLEHIFEFLKERIPLIGFDEKYKFSRYNLTFKTVTRYLESDVKRCGSFNKNEMTTVFNIIRNSSFIDDLEINSSKYGGSNIEYALECYIRVMDFRYKELEMKIYFENIAGIFAHHVAHNYEGFKAMLQKLVTELKLRKHMTADMWMDTIKEKLDNWDKQQLILV